VSGLQQAARAARYRLLAQAAARAGCTHIATAHTLDDQAETVLLRLIRGSGPGGLAAMAPAAPLPVPGTEGVTLVRPLLAIPKARLLATLSRAGIAFAEDPLNRDPRFTRARLREAMPSLAAEGLDARRLGRLAQRMRRAEAAIERAVDAAAADVSQAPWSAHVGFDAEKLAALPEEIALRLLGRAVTHVGARRRYPGVPLERLEALHGALRQAQAARGGARRLRRSLQGTLVTLAGERVSVDPAPPRRALTTAGRRGPARRTPR
jgi:tRNA(Ile)-lysidine synthase